VGGNGGRLSPEGIRTDQKVESRGVKDMEKRMTLSLVKKLGGSCVQPVNGRLIKGSGGGQKWRENYEFVGKKNKPLTPSGKGNLVERARGGGWGTI